MSVEDASLLELVTNNTLYIAPSSRAAMDSIKVADAVPETLSTPRLMHIAYLQVVKTIFKNLNVIYSPLIHSRN
jgi:hypothetical protein